MKIGFMANGIIDRTVKKVRFWLIWLLIFPFIIDYLRIKAIFTGEWDLIVPQMDLIYMCLYLKLVLKKSDQLEKELLWLRVKILASSHR
ncbi:hypothetical protein [Spirosoma foliorum]|uniref:Uncharacterized protein n=1 Tax=Spirosoma foliorum TaxID=2710596 RepID=A0A7G5GWC9_9BACT|nr:hypothetical protein [Spirosoma foliorum]QMW03171.1 hypothetical protein H3H32_35780 [Spirosoma foliorum]